MNIHKNARTTPHGREEMARRVRAGQHPGEVAQAFGVTVARVMTDNGSGYRSSLFNRVLKAADIRHRYTRPYTPKTNGKAKRFIQTALNEWA
ncbi:MAG TPA: hypothetical protein VGA50_06270 [Kiloniellales bacterium]